MWLDEVADKSSSSIDLSRAFEGTGARVQRVLRMAMDGEPVKIAGIGGSSTPLLLAAHYTGAFDEVQREGARGN